MFTRIDNSFKERHITQSLDFALPSVTDFIFLKLTCGKNSITSSNTARKCRSGKSHPNHSWALLHSDTFKPVLFVKVSKHVGTFCESIRTKYCVSEHHPLAFYKLLQYH